MAPDLNFLDCTVGKKLPTPAVAGVQQLGAQPEDMLAANALSGPANAANAGDVAELSSGVQVDFDAEGNEIRTQKDLSTGDVTQTTNKKTGVSLQVVTDANGNKKTEEALYNGVLENRSEYYPDGKTLKTSEEFEKGVPSSKKEFDEKGTLKHKIEYNSNGAMSKEAKYGLELQANDSRGPEGTQYNEIINYDTDDNGTHASKKIYHYVNGDGKSSSRADGVVADTYSDIDKKGKAHLHVRQQNAGDKKDKIYLQRGDQRSQTNINLQKTEYLIDEKNDNTYNKSYTTLNAKSPGLMNGWGFQQNTLSNGDTIVRASDDNAYRLRDNNLFGHSATNLDGKPDSNGNLPALDPMDVASKYRMVNYENP